MADLQLQYMEEPVIEGMKHTLRDQFSEDEVMLMRRVLSWIHSSMTDRLKSLQSQIIASTLGSTVSRAT